MRIVKQNRFKNLGELHKEWTEAGVKASRATTHRRVKEFGYSCRIPLVKPLLNHRQRQRRLTWAKEVSQYRKKKVENQSVSGVTTICHLLRIELIRLLIVACGMLVHSSSMAVRSCWILAGTGTRCRICRSRASQTCSMGDMSGEYAGHARTGMFSASRNCVQILATWGRALSCCNMR